MTTDDKLRSIREECTSRIRLVVAGNDAVTEAYAHNISTGGLFIRCDVPPAVGSEVVVELVLPNDQPLCRIAGIVRHARHALTPGEASAGIGIEITEFDERALQLARHFECKLSPEKKARRVPRAPLAPSSPPPLKRDGPIVGIDLGTSNSCVAIVRDGKPQVLSSTRGYQTLPSVLYVEDSAVVDFDFEFGDSASASVGGSPGAAAADAGPRIPGLEGISVRIGHQAVEQMVLRPERAIYGSKRFLGRPFESAQVKSLGHFFTYKLVAGAQGQVAAQVGEHTIPLESVAATILIALREMAEARLGHPVRRAVVTVPADYGETQRAAVREAAHLASLYVERLVNEPTAAALAYGHDKGFRRTILVYDLGGGTFDASVLRVRGEEMEVLASEGDPFLGGVDFDDRITEHVLAQLERTQKLHVRTDSVAVQRIRFTVELVKRQLSSSFEAFLCVPHLAQVGGQPVHLEMKLDRPTLERLTEDLVQRTLTIVDRVLARAGVPGTELDDVVVVGGQTRMPMVRARLTERFGKKPSQGIHPDEAVAQGASILAHRLYQDKPAGLRDILAASIRTATSDGGTLVLFQRGARLPASTVLDLTKSLVDQFALTLYRGEHDKASRNTLLGLVPLPARGSRQREQKMVLELSADGLLSAMLESGDGKRNELRVTMQRSAL